MKRNKNGISLIVLIITIIVMIVLATAVIMTLSSNAVIQKANEAVSENERAQIMEQIEIIKMDAFLEASTSNKVLTKDKLIEKIQLAFAGSTVKGNVITVQNGKYDIVVQEDLSTVVSNHGEYEGPLEDMEAIVQVQDRGDLYAVAVTVNLLNAPEVPEMNEETINNIIANEFLYWLDWNGILELAGNLLYPGAGYTAKQIFNAEVATVLGMSYDEFSNATNKNEIVSSKTGYATIEILLKNMIASRLNQDALMEACFHLAYSKLVVPDLVNKSPEEIEAVLYNWTGMPVTIDEYVSQINEQYFGITYEGVYILNKNQVALAVAALTYVDLHPVIIEYPIGTEHRENWYGTTTVDNSWIMQDNGYIVKVTSPSGYVVEKKLDNTAPTVSVAITDMANKTLTISVVANDNAPVTSGLAGEYKYYIKNKNDSDYVLKATTSDTIYTYTGLNLEQEYNILVESKDNAGNIGKGYITKSEWVTATVDGVPIPKGFVASPYGANTENNFVAENTKQNGMVIYELTDKEIENKITMLPSSESQYISWTTRNQYVWVPVDKEKFSTKFIRKDFENNTSVVVDSAGKYYPIASINNLWEIEVDEYNMPLTQEKIYNYENKDNYISQATILEAQAMYASVKEYGGFYIARYEAGIDNVRSSKGEAKDLQRGLLNVHSKMNKIPYNYIPWTWTRQEFAGNHLFDDSNGAVEVARGLYPNNTNNKKGVISTLTYGVQWDSIVQWYIDTSAVSSILDTGEYGNYYNHVINNASELNDGAYIAVYDAFSANVGEYISKTSAEYPKDEKMWILTTGALKVAKVNNIYDIAGNMSEWTMEGTLSRRQERGGYFTVDSFESSNNASLSIGARYSTSMNYNNVSPRTSFRPALYIKQ